MGIPTAGRKTIIHLEPEAELSGPPDHSRGRRSGGFRGWKLGAGSWRAVRVGWEGVRWTAAYADFIGNLVRGWQLEGESAVRSRRVNRFTRPRPGGT